MAQAREARDAARKLLAAGTDPNYAKKETKLQAALSSETTFQSVATEWASHQTERWSGDHGERILGRLKADLFPKIGHLPIAQIRPLDILNTLKKVEECGAHEVARRLLQTCNQIYRYAIVHEMTERNPAADLKGALKPYKKGHYAALDFKALPAFLSKLEHNEARLFAQPRSNPPVTLASRFLPQNHRRHILANFYPNFPHMLPPSSFRWSPMNHISTPLGIPQ